jgi:valyl-tRNA synthetase
VDLLYFQELVTVVRSLRKEYGVGEGAPVSLVLRGLTGPRAAFLRGEAGRLAQLARVMELHFGDSAAHGVGATAVMRDGTEIFLPLEGLVDLQKERNRLQEEIARLDGQARAGETKLGNESFVARAPAEIVEKEREKVTTFRGQRDKLIEKLASLEAQ